MFDSRDPLTATHAYLTSRQGNPVADRLCAAIDTLTPAAPVSLRAWLANHDALDTYQFTIRDGQPVRLWAPGVREVELRATFALFDGSRRDFAGVIHVAHSQDAYVAWDADMSALIVYLTT